MSEGLSDSWWRGNHSGKVQFSNELQQELVRLRNELRDGVDWLPEELLSHLTEWAIENHKGENK